jgi:hypothetical protein
MTGERVTSRLLIMLVFFLHRIFFLHWTSTSTSSTPSMAPPPPTPSTILLTALPPVVGPSTTPRPPLSPSMRNSLNPLKPYHQFSTSLSPSILIYRLTRPSPAPPAPWATQITVYHHLRPPLLLHPDALLPIGDDANFLVQIRAPSCGGSRDRSLSSFSVPGRTWSSH